MPKEYTLGVDVGSTTVKIALLDEGDRLILGRYERHRSDVAGALAALLGEAAQKLAAAEEAGDEVAVSLAMTGSAGIGAASRLGIGFVQEVVACARAVETYLPQADVAIELGGEDAKITYFGQTLEERMNGSCAGGTGAFIDQMAVLLDTDPQGLDRLASGATTIHPIASRCGVFAKADIQPLVNEGARREDVAASILQAVVNQTISGLACGRPIRGRVALLGGPLHYLPELRHRFASTLKLGEADILVPADGRLFVALGAALLAREASQGARPGLLGTASSLASLAQRARDGGGTEARTPRLQPLFSNAAELEGFRARHAQTGLPQAELASHQGPVFVGIDAGSTTSKLVAADAEGRVLYSSYANNHGHPLEVLVQALKDFYAGLAPGAFVAASCATGYGEGLVRAALGVDFGEVETVAHSLAASRLRPGVDSVLDIGGQDMKFLKIEEGVISSILLNEACSSGCGSFLETFARSMGLGPEAFAALALEAESPVDLGSRCTVFMNSRVKQAQKEGASPADIAAGLAYSVVKNALQKVIRIRDPRDLGQSIVVQGGTFASEAVLRAFELLTGREATRPVQTGLMGAWGAALIAQARMAETGRREQAAGLAGPAELEGFAAHGESSRCAGCGNACLLTITRFAGGTGGQAREAHLSGNRCERGAAIFELAEAEREAKANPAREGQSPRKAKRAGPPDLFAWKYERLFRYRAADPARAPRGPLGMPRVLNLYENWPFWHTLLSGLGFAPELSPRSTKAVYELGMESIPSESACYPAKLVHGHITALIKKGLPLIFYPCVPVEEAFVEGGDNCFNCPIVTSYPEVILNNVEGIREGEVAYLNPFLPIADDPALVLRLVEVFAPWKVTRAEAARAVRAARAEIEAFRAELRAEGERALSWVEAGSEDGRHGLVLAGRPYHIDPEIHHGLPGLATSLGMAVITEDAIAHLGTVDRPLRVVDQWSYHSRLYAAASFVSRRDDLDLVQLISFGCGLDAVTSDQVAEILKRGGKVYSSVKIDEHANLGAARIRLRSLAAAIEERRASGRRVHSPSPRAPRPAFTEDMRKRYTILAPQMAPIHFKVIEAAFGASGYRLEILKEAGPGAVDEGLRSVHNDACFPSILVVGQLLEALGSGRYDLSSTAVLITQTGGGCRATNYIGFIRKALADQGLGQVPVISLSATGLERNPGFRLGPGLLWRGLLACVAGDLIMRLLYRTRPYEASPGAADALAAQWIERARVLVASPGLGAYRAFCRDLVAAFDALPLDGQARKPRIGVVGEILVKFHPDANGDVVGGIEAEGGEAVVPDLYGFLLYSAYNGIFRHRALGASLKSALLARLAIGALELVRAPASRALERSGRFEAPPGIHALAESVDGIVQLGNATGEGWFLTAEMLELIEAGVSGIACLQPFACLPNHVTGKGVLKELRRLFPEVPISAIDYDPGASEVNQENRLKLLMTNARKGHAASGQAPASQAKPVPLAGRDEGEESA